MTTELKECKISIKPAFYQKLEIISEITNISIEKVVDDCLDEYFDAINDNPNAYIDTFFGHFNLMDIFEFIYKNLNK